MTRPEQNFDASTLERTLESWVADGDARRILVLLDGPVRGISEEVRLRSAPGRRVQVRAGSREGAKALGLAFLATRGRIESELDPRPAQGGGAWEAFGALASEARVWAESIRDLLQPVGGLGAVVRQTPALGQAMLPDVARKVADLADGRRTVARIIADAESDELLTARVVARLFVEQLVAPLAPDDEQDPLLPAPRSPGSHFSMPQRGWGATSALPETDLEEFEGRAVETDVRNWLKAEDAPHTLLSDEAFMGAYMSGEHPAVSSVAPTQAPEPKTAPPEPKPAAAPPREAPAPAAPVPRPTSAPPAPVVPKPAPVAPKPAPAEAVPSAPPAPTDPSAAPPTTEGAPEAAHQVREAAPYTTRTPSPADDDSYLREAGVSSGLPMWVVGLVVLAALAVVLFLARGDGPSTKTPDAGAPVAPVPTSTVTTSSVATATVATATVAEAPAPDGLRPTVAAPDAPEAVRDAEALVEAERFGEAERALAKLRRSRPNDPAVMILSGMVYVDTNRLRRANRMADRALALDRRSFRAWVLKGSVLQFQRKNTRALAAYQRALELGPTHPMSDQLRAVVASLQRQ